VSFADLPHSQQGNGSGAPSQATPRVRVRGVSKTFRATRALAGVDLDIRPGELHGLVGQNGSGKSTLMKVLSGYHAPDTGGRLEVDGREVSLPLRVTELERHGIAVVHQSLGLIPEFSVLENMRIGRLRAGRWTRRIRWSHERQQAMRVFERLGQSIDLHRPVRELSAEKRATVGIARALQDHEPGKGVILLDEATRALTRGTLKHFYELLRTVIDEGAAALLISHRLEEVLEVCDRITVLRDGRVVAAGVPAAELDEAALTRLMLGYEQGSYARDRREVSPEPVAEIKNLSGEIVKDLNLSVGRGEIVGITGLSGGGFEEVPYLIGGALAARSGVINIGGQSIDLSAGRRVSIDRLISAGIFLVPEKRDEEGLSLEMSMLDNMTLPRVGEKGSPWSIGKSWQDAEVSDMVRRLGIKPPHPKALVSTLSGGNQQKVLLGKWLAGGPRVLLLHEPTQAVDVGARRDIIQVLRGEAEAGCAVLVSATDVGDLAAMCDRVLIMRDGVVTEELTGTFDQDQIVAATFRASASVGGA
jgi:ribose transport system ATP-binding protein